MAGKENDGWDGEMHGWAYFGLSVVCFVVDLFSGRVAREENIVWNEWSLFGLSVDLLLSLFLSGRAAGEERMPHGMDGWGVFGLSVDPLLPLFLVDMWRDRRMPRGTVEVVRLSVVTLCHR